MKIFIKIILLLSLSLLLFNCSSLKKTTKSKYGIKYYKSKTGLITKEQKQNPLIKFSNKQKRKCK